MTLRHSLIILILAAAALPASADETLFRYEGNVLPYDESLPELDRWLIFNPCEEPCSESLEDGHFVLRWTVEAERVDYTLKLTRPEPPPSVLDRVAIPLQPSDRSGLLYL